MADCNDYIGKLTQEATAGTAAGDNDIAQQLAKLSFSDAMDTTYRMAARKECSTNGNELLYEPGAFGRDVEHPFAETSLIRGDPKAPWYRASTEIFHQALWLGVPAGDWGTLGAGSSQPKREVMGPDGKIIPDSVQK